MQVKGLECATFDAYQGLRSFIANSIQSWTSRSSMDEEKDPVQQFNIFYLFFYSKNDKYLYI
jgi:hypothetical protein